jgi:GNAT superfamily N-acetyltransferase
MRLMQATTTRPTLRLGTAAARPRHRGVSDSGAKPSFSSPSARSKSWVSPSSRAMATSISYTHARFLRQGVAAALLRVIEDEARSHGVDHLFAEGSLTARPFFDHAGFRLVGAQTVERGGEEFVNYRMEKLL